MTVKKQCSTPNKTKQRFLNWKILRDRSDCTNSKSKYQKIRKTNMVPHTCTPSLERQRQEDHSKFAASLVYTVNSKPAWAREWGCFWKSLCWYAVWVVSREPKFDQQHSRNRCAGAHLVKTNTQEVEAAESSSRSFLTTQVVQASFEYEALSQKQTRKKHQPPLKL